MEKINQLTKDIQDILDLEERPSPIFMIDKSNQNEYFTESEAKAIKQQLIQFGYTFIAQEDLFQDHASYLFSFSEIPLIIKFEYDKEEE